MRVKKYEMRDKKCEMRDKKCEIKNVRCEIGNDVQSYLLENVIDRPTQTSLCGFMTATREPLSFALTSMSLSEI